MWVVKLGGSMNADPLLPQWLDLLAELGRGRVTVVCGGGTFAEEVRRVQAHWQFGDLAAHNMAVLSMAQTAYLAHGLNDQLRLATGTADILKVLHSGHTALWLPLDMVRARMGPHTNWDHTADSMALRLASKLNAERLVVVKSCAVDPHASLAELSESGVVDGGFLALSRSAPFQIELMQRDELSRMRELLLSNARCAPA